MKSNKGLLLDQLLRSRFRSNKDLSRLFDSYRGDHVVRRRQRQSRPIVLQGVHKGTFYRVRVPPHRQPVLPNIPKLPPPMSAQPPMSFKSTSVSAAESSSSSSSTVSSTTSHHSTQQASAFQSSDEYWRRLYEWWKENWSIIVLNLGSICTLAAFTRSDVLELRSLSVVGSTCSVVYQLTLVPLRWMPILWSMLFAGVNSFKIYNILEERRSFVRLTGDQELIYVQHFMPHGVTPKQFEILYTRAKLRRYPKGSLILKQGDKMEQVRLVVKGATRATILGRRVSAASLPLVESDKNKSDRPSQPGDSTAKASAWIGEMSFLEKYWIQEQLRLQPRKQSKPADSSDGETQDEAPSTEILSPETSDDEMSREVEMTKEQASTVAARTSKDKKAGTSTQVTLASKRTVRPMDVSKHIVPEAKTEYSMYTIVALDDCVVLEWSHEDMQALMEHSTDLRAALTRALSSAIVGKVINFTISKSQAHRSWSQWLDDWKHSDGATIHVQEDDETNVDSTTTRGPLKVGDVLVPEALPTHPIKKFT